METTKNDAGQWSPKIVAFFCNWCTYTASDLAGVSRLRYAPSTRVVRVMCSGRIEPEHIFEAFAKGADGVLIGGCHPGDCHYSEGNYKCLRRYTLIQKYIRQMGLDDKRLRLEWISAAEGKKLQEVVNEMTETLVKLGPSNYKKVLETLDI